MTAVVSVVLLFTFGVRLISVNGPSMQNTLYTGDELLILNSMFCAFQAGDVVVLNAYNAEEPLSETLVKRIVAVGARPWTWTRSPGPSRWTARCWTSPTSRSPPTPPRGRSSPHPGGGRGLRHGGQPQPQLRQPGYPAGGRERGLPPGKVLLLLIPGATPETEARDWSRIGVLR